MEDGRCICPIFKKGKKNEAGNYRPVSLTSVVCKIMESIIKESLVKYAEANKLIADCQHGFMRGRSCLTNLLESFEMWTRAVDEGYGLDIIYLDYKKAFDTVPHRRLLYKLKTYGITDKYIDWIKGFLASRKMRVTVNGSFSSWKDIFSGVPQGSVLGPLLFILFVTDLPQWIKNSMRVFADDTKVWKIIKTTSDAQGLQDDLDGLQRWSDNWLLKLNASKCKVMHVNHAHQTQYFIEEGQYKTELEVVTEERDLGVLVTSDLKPGRQCVAAAAKASAVLGLIKRNFKAISVTNFRTLYKTYIRPHLEYCVQAWSPSLERDIACLERVQRRATKMVKGLKGKSYEDRLRICGLTTLHRRRIRGDLIETFKIMTGREGVKREDFFQIDEGQRTRGHSMKIYKQRCRTTLRQSTFSNRVVDDWNALPQTVINAESVNQFKNGLDKYWTDMGV